MTITKGIVGGLLRAAAAGYLLAGGLLLPRFEELIEGFKTSVETAVDADAILTALQQYAASAVDLMGELAQPLLIVVVLWIFGGHLLSRAWSDLDRDWPRLARWGFKLLGLVFMLLALVGLVIPARFFIQALIGGLGELLDYLNIPLLAQAAPFLIILPLTLPVFKALITLKYTQGRGRLGSLLLVAGGLLYVVAAYQVYNAYRLGNAIVGHVQALMVQGLQAEAVLREASLTLADMGLLMIGRLEGLLTAIVGASVLYALGFALHKPRPKVKNPTPQ